MDNALGSTEKYNLLLLVGHAAFWQRGENAGFFTSKDKFWDVNMKV